jgi:hypothetical protein
MEESVLLSVKQALFTYRLAQLLVWIAEEQKLLVTMREGYVGDTDRADGDYDGPHKKGGLHYMGLAQDLMLYRKPDGVPLTDGGAPEWRAVGEKWESMGGTWGGRFGDANHFSLAHAGKK